MVSSVSYYYINIYPLISLQIIFYNMYSCSWRDDNCETCSTSIITSGYYCFRRLAVLSNLILQMTANHEIYQRVWLTCVLHVICRPYYTNPKMSTLCIVLLFCLRQKSIWWKKSHSLYLYWGLGDWLFNL